MTESTTSIKERNEFLRGVPLEERIKRLYAEPNQSSSEHEREEKELISFINNIDFSRFRWQEFENFFDILTKFNFPLGAEPNEVKQAFQKKAYISLLGDEVGQQAFLEALDAQLTTSSEGVESSTVQEWIDYINPVGIGNEKSTNLLRGKATFKARINRIFREHNGRKARR